MPDGPLVSHQRVVARAEEALDRSIDAPIYVRELCSAAGVSERTLRNAFQSLYGVSPIRLLHLRRLHQVRRVLRDDATASVTEVALRFGFVNLGRFAVEYRQLFSESPSHSATRMAGVAEEHEPASRLCWLPMWIRVAAIVGFVGVACGAFGAHALRARLTPDQLAAWQTAVHYQLVHGVVLLALGLYGAATSRPLGPAPWLFAAGIVGFSGSIYGLVLGGWRILGPVTPIGGLALIAGWVALLWLARAQA